LISAVFFSTPPDPSSRRETFRQVKYIPPLYYVNSPF
jgi:hypothetical protein